MLTVALPGIYYQHSFMKIKKSIFFQAKNLRVIALYSFHTKNIVLFQNQPVWTPKTKTLRVQNLDTLVQLSLPV